MRIASNFGYRIAYHNHPIIVLDPSAHGIGNTDTCGHTDDDTGRDPHVAKGGIERRIGEATKSLLHDQMFDFPWL